MMVLDATMHFGASDEEDLAHLWCRAGLGPE